MNNHENSTAAYENPSGTVQIESSEISDSDSDDNENGETRYVSRRTTTRRTKRDSALKDQQSTGRKRAARMYPLNREAPCEWRGKANCGGGTFPIVGCVSGLQEARHHGPDKSVVNNEEGNVHRICHYCHYNWHAKNNADYDWNSTAVNQHRPKPATQAQLQKASVKELIYKQGKKVKIRD